MNEEFIVEAAGCQEDKGGRICWECL